MSYAGSAVLCVAGSDAYYILSKRYIIDGIVETGGVSDMPVRPSGDGISRVWYLVEKMCKVVWDLSIFISVVTVEFVACQFEGVVKS